MNQFSTSDWIGIVGILVSIILAFAFYQKVIKKRIVLVLKNHFVLNNISNSEYPNFKVFLDDEEISNHLYYVSGTFVMYGDGDVAVENIRHPICLIIKESVGIWIKNKVLNKSTLLECETNTQENMLKFQTSDIKSRDYINFEAYYSATKIGLNAYHRVLDVKKDVLVLDENSFRHHKRTAISSALILLFICLVNYGTSPSVQENLWNDNYTKTTKVIDQSKIDSFLNETVVYQPLYYVNNLPLQNDKILIHNGSLNEIKNKVRKKIELDSLQTQMSIRNLPILKTADSLEIMLHDSLYYHDDNSLKEISQNKIRKLLVDQTEINEQGKYRINDTIFVSFVNINETSTDVFVSNFVMIVLIIIHLVLLSLFFYSLYFLNILFKYSKIYKTIS